MSLKHTEQEHNEQGTPTLPTHTQLPTEPLKTEIRTIRRIRRTHRIGNRLRRLIYKEHIPEWVEGTVTFLASVIAYYFGGGVSRERGLLWAVIAAVVGSFCHHLNDLLKWLMGKARLISRLSPTAKLGVSASCACAAVLLGHFIQSHI